jgi:hypothetical protein
MPTYEKAPKEVTKLADDLLNEFPSHQPIIDADVRIDILMAYAPLDKKTQQPKGVALKLHGARALGICKVVSLKDRVKGCGDVEIRLDGDWWREAALPEQRAVLDHELHHIFVIPGETDDIERPVVVMREHDYQFGMFVEIAKRHGSASIEQKMCRKMIEEAGQFLFPGISASAAHADQTEAAVARARR